MEVRRYEVYLVSLDPAQGHEIRKTRPALVLSPDEMNSCIGTIIVAPMTTKTRSYPTRVSCKFRGKSGEIVLDQLRTIDKPGGTDYWQIFDRLNIHSADYSSV